MLGVSFGSDLISFVASAAICLVNGRQINEVSVFTTVCNIAIWYVMFSSGVPGTIQSISWSSGCRKMIARITVMTLKSTCTSAHRFASAFAFHAASTASIVEPMLLPMTSAAENSQEISPLYAMVMTIAVSADEECISAVSTMPMTTPMRMLQKPKSPQC